jgi:peroxiredoxin
MKLAMSFVLVALLAGCSKEDGKAPAAKQQEPQQKEAPPKTEQPRTAPPSEAAPAAATVGKPAPDFTLPGLDGKEASLSSFRGKVVVLEWFNPGCPFVQRSHTKGSLVDTARRAADAGVVWLAVNSAAPGKQGSDVAENQDAVKRWAMGHPVLRDETGKVGKAYGATNTPNMFVIDKEGTLVYAGAIDNSPDGEGASPTDGKLVNYVDAALADLAAGRPVATSTTKPYGCSVKYAN